MTLEGRAPLTRTFLALVLIGFFARFGLSVDVIGLIFSASSLLSAMSFMLAARISDRIGLINTMVYSHLPANLMTMAIPHMPTLAHRRLST